MPLIESELANFLYQSLRYTTDRGNKETPTTAYMQTYARGYCTMLRAGLFSHAPGTVTGVGIPGGPLSQGAATQGLLVLDYNMMLNITAAGFPPQSRVLLGLEHTAVANYVMLAGRVNFDPGNIHGTCTATSVSPGVLGGGFGANGKIISLDGDACAQMVQSVSTLSGPDRPKFYKTLMDYTMQNASASYLPGSVTGTFSKGSGSLPLSSGAGVGGVVI